MCGNLKKKHNSVRIPKIYPVTSHTDHVGPGSTFVVIKGLAHNGCAYIATALQRGASTIVVDQELSEDLHQQAVRAGVKIEQVANARKALAELSAQASDQAHKKLKLIGITGTKGKTTTAHLLFHMLKGAGIKTALLSTVNNVIGDMQFSSSLTTPQPDYLHQFFKVAVANGIEWVVMEVAAQAVSLHRIEGLQFDAVIMTNFAREHLEFYDSMETYFADKIKLLAYRKPLVPAWINRDDTVLSHIKADHINWFGCKKKGVLAGALHNTTDFTLSADVIYRATQYRINCPTLSGEYNLSNILAAIGGALTVGLSFDEIKEGIATFPAIAGRQERYKLANGATVLIDYAHNPLSYWAFFKTIDLLTDHVIVVFGAGGDRDQGRRPEMGAIVAQYADILIITTDNPRHEDPEKIVADILRGIPENIRDSIICEPDRKKAIEKAYALSRKDSIIALLGKGPEEYQLIGDTKIPFSEREILLKMVGEENQF